MFIYSLSNLWNLINTPPQLTLLIIIAQSLSLFQAPRWWWKVVKWKEMRKTRGGSGETGRRPIFPAATAPFPKSCASYFRFARFNTFPLYYLRAWHKVRHECKTKRAFETREKGTSRKMKANRKKGMQLIVGCHSRDQLLCKFLETFFYMWKEINENLFL